MEERQSCRLRQAASLVVTDFGLECSGKDLAKLAIGQRDGVALHAACLFGLCHDFIEMLRGDVVVAQGWNL